MIFNANSRVAFYAVVLVSCPEAKVGQAFFFCFLNHCHQCFNAYDQPFLNSKNTFLCFAKVSFVRTGGGGNDARVNQNFIDSDAQFTDKNTNPLDANSAIIGNTESLFEGSNIMWRRK
jgi:hypothetical protein